LYYPYVNEEDAVYNCLFYHESFLDNQVLMLDDCYDIVERFLGREGKMSYITQACDDGTMRTTDN